MGKFLFAAKNYRRMMQSGFTKAQRLLKR